MMSKKWILSIIFLTTLGSGYISAQNIKLNKYKFGEGLDFSSADGNNKMEISGYVQSAIDSRKYLDTDDDKFYNRYRIRRARLQFAGSSKEDKINYRLQLDLTGGGESDANTGSILFDAWVQYSATKNIKIAFGQKATPTDNRELGTRSNTLQLTERSPLTSAFATIREFGIFVESTHRLSTSSYLKPEIAVTNGDGINVFTKDRGGLKYGGRIDYLPFGLFNNFGQYRQADLVRELTPKLIVGIHSSYNVGISDRRGSRSATILYLDANDNELLPDYVKYGADFLFKYQGFSLLGEYIHGSSRVPSGITQRIRNNGTLSKEFLVNGVQNVADYVRGRIMEGEGFNLQGGYVFKNLYSIDGRFSHLKPQKNSFLNDATFYNRSHFYTLGVTKYLARNYATKIQLDCTYMNSKSGSLNLEGTPIKGNEILTRVITTFSF
jgi:hypothetical protein